MARWAWLTWSTRCHHSARRPTWFHPRRAGPDSAAARGSRSCSRHTASFCRPVDTASTIHAGRQARILTTPGPGRSSARRSGPGPSDALDPSHAGLSRPAASAGLDGEQARAVDPSLSYAAGPFSPAALAAACRPAEEMLSLVPSESAPSESCFQTPGPPPPADDKVSTREPATAQRLRTLVSSTRLTPAGAAASSPHVPAAACPW
mmetsp:Transcript_10357/g.22095  ORF Transcript_10357/g.22095 Transcript_10357/m.22095 type:complete len:206 (+) Transcript_10357:125-742(+)